MATLAVFRGDQFLQRIELGKAPLRIGRAPENELVLEDKDKGVSRNHAEIRYERGRFVAIDLNSQNGIWLGRRRITRDTLPVGVPLTIGPYRLVLEEPESQPQADATSEDVPESVEAGVSAEAEPTHLPNEPRMGGSTPGTLAAQPLPPKRHVGRLVAIGASAVVLIAVAVVLGKYAMSGKAEPPKPTPPPPPTLEQRFQEKYKLAQAYLEKHDKEAATKANQEALGIRPGDPRAVDQQRQILALEVPPPPPPVPPPPVTPAPIETNNEPAKEVRPRAQNSLTIANIKGESPRDRVAREKAARNFLEDGIKNFREGKYEMAIRLLENALTESRRKDYGHSPLEARQLIDQAADLMAQRDREEKAKRIADQLALAQQRDDAGDIVGEMRALQEIKRLDPARPAIDDRIGKLQARALTEGEKAFLQARNYEAARGRSRSEDALKSFDKAVQLFELVPGGSPNLEYARKRRDELKPQP